MNSGVFQSWFAYTKVTLKMQILRCHSLPADGIAVSDMAQDQEVGSGSEVEPVKDET